VITERLSHRSPHKDVILRGDHVRPFSMKWGKDYPLFENAESMRSYLLQMPVPVRRAQQPAARLLFPAAGR
jgi:hypothetical protein